MSEVRVCAEPRFVPAHIQRKGSPRAVRPESRAKLVHTSTGGRRIEAFITAPLVRALGWREGGSVRVEVARDGENLLVRLSPAHSGPRVLPSCRTSTTCRVCISGDFIAPSACAPVRIVAHEKDGSRLLLRLPLAWAASDGRGVEAEKPADVNV